MMGLVKTDYWPKVNLPKTHIHHVGIELHMNSDIQGRPVVEDQIPL